MGDVFAMLMFDFVFYLLLAFYVDFVKPGPYGLAKPLHFPISVSINTYNRLLIIKMHTYIFLCDIFQCILRKICNKQPVQISDEASGGCFEDSPLNLTPGIKIRNLHKKYGQFEAVKGVSLDIYKDQITVLLGHNGAGKSTTMSMITGMNIF